MSTEENKLIAFFDGAEKSKVDNDTRYLRFPEPKGGTYAFYVSDLKYHSSWDWLMPVVEKIRELWGSPTIDMQLLEEDVTASKIKHLRIWSPIESVYECVIDFILWYNTQNK